MVDAGARHRLLAILAADAVGYSRLMASDDAAALTALDAARDVFGSEAASQRGRIVDTAGDSVLAVFDTASGALDYALIVQQRLAAVTSTPRLPFRIGVHLGDVIEKVDGSVYGNGVNVAARLQSLAGADEIWLSAAVRDAVGGRVARRMLDKGLHTVKNIDEPVHAYVMDWRSSADAPRPAKVKPQHKAAWVLAGVSLLGLALSALLSSGAWHDVGARGEASTLRPLSVAIGTISAAPGDAGAAEAAERLRDDLRSELSRRRNVISVMADEGANAASAAPLRARTGGARFLVDATVRPEGDGHVASVHLLDVSSSTQAWSDDVKLPATAAERRAAGRALGTQVFRLVMSSEQRRVLAAPIDQLSAPELSVRAMAVYDRDSTLAGIDRALPLTERALQLDPNSFIALNTKAYLLLNRYDEEATPDHDRYARELDALSSRQLAIDPRDPLAWLHRSGALQFNGQWTAALDAMDKMAEQEPDHQMGAFTRLNRAELLIALGRPAEALQVLDAESVRAAGDARAEIEICHANLLLLRPQVAKDVCERAVGSNPKWWSTNLWLASARAQLGDIEGARTSLRVVDRMSPGQSIDRLRRRWPHPEYQRLAEVGFYPGLRQAGLPER